MGAINELGAKVGAIYKDGIMYSGVVDSGSTPSPSPSPDVPLEDKDVIFIDYDGTVLYGYSAEEFLALTEMPANPDHTSEGLVSQGWNWTLADAQAYVETYGKQCIGQMYDTYDGNTRYFISIPNGDGERKKIGVQWYSNVADTIRINWGDNSEDSYGSNAGAVVFEHEYASYGDYVITIIREEGAKSFGPTGALSSTYNESSYALDRYLKKVYIGSSATKIDGTSYYCCSSLECITLHSSSTILSYTFRGCSSLSSITIPNVRQAIGTYTFSECTSLKTVSLPNSITGSLASFAFGYCISLKFICLPSSMTSLASNAFSTSGIEYVIIPSSVTSISSQAFMGCRNIKKISFPSGLSSIPDGCFQNCSSLEEVVFPSSGLTKIGSNAFSSCFNLKSLAIPSTVTSIGNYAFASCYKLRSITLSDATAIGNSLLNGCCSLKELTIPATVTSIGTNILNTCYSLTRIYMKPTTPPTITTTTFSNSSALNRSDAIVVPHGCGEAYKTATNWSKYADFIVEMDE